MVNDDYDLTKIKTVIFGIHSKTNPILEFNYLTDTA